MANETLMNPKEENHSVTDQQSIGDNASLGNPEGTIVLCPGQGAQHVGMGRSWFEQSPAAKEIFKTADQALGFELSRICFEGPADQLNRTEISQPAIYTTSIACFAGLKEQGQIGLLSATAGLSLGEFTALHLAGAFDFITGLRLVHLRGQAMQNAADTTIDGGSMVAIVGANDQQADQLCEQTLAQVHRESPQEVLVVANYNCPGQIVISGNQKACKQALVEATKMGLRATPLTVAGAFHSPLMAPAATDLKQALDKADWQLPQVTVLSNTTALPHLGNDIATIKNGLEKQLTHPVQWTSSMNWLVRRAKGRYVELAPGKVLTGLMRRIDRKHRVLNCAQPVPLVSEDGKA